jgi:hypothetical protein
VLEGLADGFHIHLCADIGPWIRHVIAPRRATGCRPVPYAFACNRPLS